MPSLRRPLPAALLAALALAAVGCGQGDSGLLPKAEARELSGTVQQIGMDVNEGDCTGAQGELVRARTAVNGLPPSVDDALLGNIRDWLDQVSDGLAGCTPATPSPGPTTTELTTTETTAPTDTQPTETTTTAPDTDTDPDPEPLPTDPVPTDPAQPESDNGGQAPPGGEEADG